MKKYISFLVTILLCFQFIFTNYSFANNAETMEPHVDYIKENLQNTQKGIANYNELYGIEPLEEAPSTLNQKSRSNHQNVKYLAIFIKFKDNNNQHQIDDADCVKNAETIFNSNEMFEMITVNGNTEEKIKVPSFKKYYEMQSYGKLSITTEIFPKVGNNVVSYETTQPIEYYLKYSDQNPKGYKNAGEALQRETELINEAVAWVSGQIELAGITKEEIDADGNNIVDAISFFVEGKSNLQTKPAWGDILWSHKLDNTGVTKTILNKNVVPYNLIYVEDYTQAASIFSLNRSTYGTIIHEFGHTLGYMDLYRHNASSNRPVGFYDVMGNTVGSNPQNLLTYFTSEYRVQTNWHKPLEVITKTTNQITLYKPKFIDDNEKRAIKIQQYAGGNEYFVIEYHEKQNTYESYSADKSGIIVYRVNEARKGYGNAYEGEHGKNDHIFIFRPNETALGDGKGNLREATLNDTRKILGKEIQKDNNTFDNETIYYSDGSNSGIVVEVISQTSEAVTFNVTFPSLQGDGTKGDPYLIYDIDTFFYLMKRETKNQYYKFMKDLDFANIQNYPQIDFKGNLDGNNKTLKNISAVGTGVFNTIGDAYSTPSIIENLNIENINIKPGKGEALGGFANTIENTTVRNIHLKSGEVKNIKSLQYNDLASTGGFVGNIYETATIDNCSTSLQVSSEKNVGGFIGMNSNATIKNSYANGVILANENLGGFIGIQYVDDKQYKEPQNVYFDYSKTKIANAVGGVTSFIPNLTIPSKEELEKGIIGISVPEVININKAEEVNYTVTTKPSINLPFSITSSDVTVVQYANNKLQGIKNGTAQVNVELKVGEQNMKMKTQVNVSNLSENNIEITSIVLNKNKIELNEQEIEQLQATLNPNNHTMSKQINWASSNPKVASVDNNGKVTAKLEGTTTITATTVNGKSANCVVIVKKKTIQISETEVLKHFGLTKKDSYVVGFKVGSSISNIKGKLSSYPNVTLSSFKDASGNEISSGTIATNMKFTLTFNGQQYHYTVVIKGDVNGDGSIYATDYVRIKNHIMGKTTLTGAYLKAADINNDNNVYATDYVKIKNYIMGKGNIMQEF